MAKSTSVNLSDYFCRFIDEQVAAGRYGSASEVVRDGLRLLVERQERLERLRKALDDGDASGEAVPFDMREWLAEQDRLDDVA
jgi:antitoxin ParD1/3/4